MNIPERPDGHPTIDWAALDAETDALMASSTPSQRRHHLRRFMRERDAYVARLARKIAVDAWRRERGSDDPDIAREIRDLVETNLQRVMEGSGRDAATFRDQTEQMALVVIADLRQIEARLQTLDATLEQLDAAKHAFNQLNGEERSTRDGSNLIRKVVALWDKVASLDSAFITFCGASGHAIPDFDKQEAEIAERRVELNAWLDYHRATERDAALQRRRIAATPSSTETPHCAEPGCTKARHFYDDNGVGYCKRHGNERGLRPHGKVT